MFLLGPAPAAEWMSEELCALDNKLRVGMWHEIPYLLILDLSLDYGTLFLSTTGMWSLADSLCTQYCI